MWFEIQILLKIYNGGIVSVYDGLGHLRVA